MRADSRCLSRKAFSAPPAARHTPRGGNGVPIAASMGPRQSAMLTAGGSWRRRSPNSSSAPENGRKTSAVPLPHNAPHGSAAAEHRRGARNPSARSSAAKAQPSSNSRSNRSPKVSSAHAGGGAAVAVARDSKLGGSQPRARSRALHRISLARSDRGPKARGRDRPRLHPRDRLRLHPVKVARVAAIASAASAAGAAVVVAAGTLRRSRLLHEVPERLKRATSS